MSSNIRDTSNSQIADRLTYQGASENTVVFEDQVKKWFGANMKRMIGLCGSEQDAKRMLLAALNAVSKVPTLMECSFDSFARCLLTSAEYRLYPGAMQECAYLPFKGVATFVIMYPGLCQLLYRSGMIKDIEAEVVHSRDFFDFTRGSNRKLVFEPYDGDEVDRGERIGVYCIIRNTFGGEHIKYLTAREVMGLKARSQAAKSSFSPWNSEHPLDVDWMWMKSALKQNKFVPKSPMLAAALAEDADEISLDDTIGEKNTRRAVAAATQPNQKTIAQDKRVTIDIPVDKGTQTVSSKTDQTKGFETLGVKPER